MRQSTFHIAKEAEYLDNLYNYNEEASLTGAILGKTIGSKAVTAKLATAKAGAGKAVSTVFGNGGMGFVLHRKKYSKEYLENHAKMYNRSKRLRDMIKDDETYKFTPVLATIGGLGLGGALMNKAVGYKPYKRAVRLFNKGVTEQRKTLKENYGYNATPPNPNSFSNLYKEYLKTHPEVAEKLHNNPVLRDNPIVNVIKDN